MVDYANRQERFAVDLDGLGEQLKVALVEILDPPSSGDLGPYNEKLAYVYDQTFQQIFVPMDNQIEEYMLRMAVYPQMGYFGHITEFQDPNKLRRYIDIFKEIAVRTAILINQKVNRENSSVDYLMETVNYRYTVILKCYKNY